MSSRDRMSSGPARYWRSLAGLVLGGCLVTGTVHAGGWDFLSRIATGLDGKLNTCEAHRRELRTYGSQTVTDSPDQATHSLAEIRQHWKNRYSHIESLHLRFERKTVVHIPRQVIDPDEEEAAPEDIAAEEPLPEPVRKVEPASDGVPAAPTETRETVDFFLKGKQRLLRTTLQGQPGETVYGFDGKTSKRLHRDISPTGCIEPGHPEYVEDEPRDFLLAISFPVTRPEGFVNHPYSIAEVLKQKDFEYRVEPRLEVVDGHPCHVVTCGHDTLWLDHAHGFALRRRLVFDRTGAPGIGHLSHLLCCGDYQDPFFPGVCERHLFLSCGDTGNRLGQLQTRETITVRQREINTVQDDDLIYHFPPGTLVTDLVANKLYWMPKSIDFLEQAIELGTTIVNGEATFPRELPKTLQK